MRTLGLIAGLAVGLGLLAAPATGQDYVGEGVAKAIEQASAARDLTGFGLRSGGFCLLGGFVEEGKELAYTARLQAGKGYLFVGAGDADVHDLDLVVAAKDGSVHEVDVDDDSTPFVFVAPEHTGEFTITLSLASGSGSQDFSLVIVLETDGLKGSLATLEQASHELNAVISAAAEQVNLGFDAAPNSFCLLGALLKDGADQTLTRSFAAHTKYVIVGWSDSHAKDFDIAVKRGKEILVQDVEDDNTPVVVFECPKNERLGLNLEMFSAGKPAFAIAAVLVTSEK